MKNDEHSRAAAASAGASTTRDPSRARCAEDVLRACRILGPVRLVMRNPIGLVEGFADLAGLQLTGEWANLVTDTFHLHLEVDRVRAIDFLPASEQRPPARASAIALRGERGCPLLVLVLDLATGPALEAQLEAFERLRAELGGQVPLIGAGARPPGVALH